MAEGQSPQPDSATKQDGNIARRRRKPAKQTETAPCKNDGKDRIQQRARAVEVIGRYAGENAREAQKTKWLVDMVMKVDAEYKDNSEAQAARIAELEAQLQALQASSSEALQAAHAESQHLRTKLESAELALYNSAFSQQEAQGQAAALAAALRFSEDAAALATAECAHLAGALRAMTEADARARRGLAHRAHHLKQALLDASARLREYGDRERKERREQESGLRAREVALAAERREVLAAQAGRDTLEGELEAWRLRYHLAAVALGQGAGSGGTSTVGPAAEEAGRVEKASSPGRGAPPKP